MIDPDRGFPIAIAVNQARVRQAFTFFHLSFAEFRKVNPDMNLTCFGYFFLHLVGAKKIKLTLEGKPQEEADKTQRIVTAILKDVYCERIFIKDLAVEETGSALLVAVKEELSCHLLDMVKEEIRLRLRSAKLALAEFACLKEIKFEGLPPPNAERLIRVLSKMVGKVEAITRKDYLEAMKQMNYLGKTFPLDFPKTGLVITQMWRWLSDYAKEPEKPYEEPEAGAGAFEKKEVKKRVFEWKNEDSSSEEEATAVTAEASLRAEIPKAAETHPMRVYLEEKGCKTALLHFDLAERFFQLFAVSPNPFVVPLIHHLSIFFEQMLSSKMDEPPETHYLGPLIEGAGGGQELALALQGFDAGSLWSRYPYTSRRNVFCAEDWFALRTILACASDGPIEQAKVVGAVQRALTVLGRFLEIEGDVALRSSAEALGPAQDTELSVQVRDLSALLSASPGEEGEKRMKEVRFHLNLIERVLRFVPPVFCSHHGGALFGYFVHSVALVLEIGGLAAGKVVEQHDLLALAEELKSRGVRVPADLALFNVGKTIDYPKKRKGLEAGTYAPLVREARGVTFFKDDFAPAGWKGRDPKDIRNDLVLGLQKGVRLMKDWMGAWGFLGDAAP
jgi:hypothetical protein